MYKAHESRDFLVAMSLLKNLDSTKVYIKRNSIYDSIFKAII